MFSTTLFYTVLTITSLPSPQDLSQTATGGIWIISIRASVGYLCPTSTRPCLLFMFLAPKQAQQTGKRTDNHRALTGSGFHLPGSSRSDHQQPTFNKLIDLSVRLNGCYPHNQQISIKGIIRAPVDLPDTRTAFDPHTKVPMGAHPRCHTTHRGTFARNCFNPRSEQSFDRSLHFYNNRIQQRLANLRERSHASTTSRACARTKTLR